MSGFDGNGTFACLSAGYLDLPPNAHKEPGHSAPKRGGGYVAQYLNEVMESLYARIEEKISVDAQTGCWNWTGMRDDHGYGRVSFNGRPRMAYRVTYELYCDEIPAGLCLDHLCRNPPCVNPEHLEPVTLGENARRGKMKERRYEWLAKKTHCKSGHELEQMGKQRGCRTCTNSRRRELRKLIGPGTNLAGLKLGAAASVAARRKKAEAK